MSALSWSFSVASALAHPSLSLPSEQSTGRCLQKKYTLHTIGMVEVFFQDEE